MFRHCTNARQAIDALVLCIICYQSGQILIAGLRARLFNHEYFQREHIGERIRRSV